MSLIMLGAFYVVLGIAVAEIADGAMRQDETAVNWTRRHFGALYVLMLTLWPLLLILIGGYAAGQRWLDKDGAGAYPWERKGRGPWG